MSSSKNKKNSQPTEKLGNDIERRTFNSTWVSDSVARSIGLYNYLNFQFYDIRDSLRYFLDLPLFVVNTKDVVNNVINTKTITELCYNNIDMCDDMLLSIDSFTKQENKIISRQMINDFCDYNNYDSIKRNNIFLTNGFSKSREYVIDKYEVNKSWENKKETNKFRKSDVKWLYKQLNDPNIKDFYSKIVNDDLTKIYPSSTLKRIRNLMATMIQVDKNPPEDFFDHFFNIYELILAKQQVTKKTYLEKLEAGTPIEELKETRDILTLLVVYYKLLALRVFEYLDFFRFVYKNKKELVVKFSRLLINIEVQLDEMSEIKY